MWDLWMIFKNSVATSGPSEACTISPVGKGPTDLTNLAMSVKCHAFLNVAQPFVFLEGRWRWRKRTASTIEEEGEGDCTMLKITNRNSFLGIYGYQWNIRSQSQNDFIHTWGQMWDLWMIYKNSVATSGPSEACTISPVGKGPTDLTNLAMSVKCHAFLNVAQPFVFLEGLWRWRKRTASTIEEEGEGDGTMLKITNRNSFLGIYGYQWNIRSQSQNDFIHTWGQMWDLWMIYKNSVATSGHSQACTISPFGKGRIDLTNLAITFFFECCANFCFLEGGSTWRKRTASTIEEDSGDCQVLKITNTNVLLGTWKIWDSSKNHHEVISEITQLFQILTPCDAEICPLEVQNPAAPAPPLGSSKPVKDCWAGFHV